MVYITVLMLASVGLVAPLACCAHVWKVLGFDCTGWTQVDTSSLCLAKKGLQSYITSVRAAASARALLSVVNTHSNSAQSLGTDLPLWVAKENDVTREMLAPLIAAFPKVTDGSSFAHRASSAAPPPGVDYMLNQVAAPPLCEWYTPASSECHLNVTPTPSAGHMWVHQLQTLILLSTLYAVDPLLGGLRGGGAPRPAPQLPRHRGDHGLQHGRQVLFRF